MALRRLVTQMQTLMQNGDVQGLRNDRNSMIGASQPSDSDQAFFETGFMVQVFGTAGGVVQFRGRTVQARQSNDEPLTAGQMVYVTKTANGEFVVDGSVKG